MHEEDLSILLFYLLVNFTGTVAFCPVKIMRVCATAILSQKTASITKYSSSICLLISLSIVREPDITLFPVELTVNSVNNFVYCLIKCKHNRDGDQSIGIGDDPPLSFFVLC